MSKNLGSKEKILQSACKLFAQKGFKQTTVRDICADSGSYQISVNYYFGSKENLFKEAVLKSFEYTGFGNIAESIDGIEPKEQLYRILKARIGLTFVKDEKSWFFDILSKEFNVNMELLKPLIPQTLAVFLGLLKDIFRKINPKANDFDIEYCCFLFIAQSFSLAMNSFAKKRLFSGDNPPPEEIERLSRKMYDYIIMGLEKSDTELKNE